MLNILRRGGGRFEVQSEDHWSPSEDVIWIDLLRPTREEELAVEAALGLDLPTAEEMARLEPSSRLYQEGGATFMTATLLARSDEDRPVAQPVTFVLANGVLVSLRYEQFKAFSIYAERAGQQDAHSGAKALLGLLDAVVERLAQILEEAAGDVDSASNAIFDRPAGGNFQPLLTDLARAQSVTSLARKSLTSLSRVLSFAVLAREMGEDKACGAHLKSLQRDAQSLIEQSSFQSGHISFLLDAALGLINIEQNGIIKFFSVVAVIFLPPTLVASIYGMNFHHMPELDWKLGYPLALLLMVVSAVAPLWWFRRRGWL